MPVCRNCGARISKFDNDMCPICGVKKPLEGVTSETVEITTEINMNDPSFKNYKPTKRSIACLLFCLLGIFGAGFYYVKRVKLGLIWLAINLVLIGGLGTVLAFVVNIGPLLGYLIPVGVCYLANIGIGIYQLAKPNLKDGNGEFMR